MTKVLVRVNNKNVAAFSKSEDAVRYAYDRSYNTYTMKIIDGETIKEIKVDHPSRSWLCSHGVPYEELYDENPDIDYEDLEDDDDEENDE